MTNLDLRQVRATVTDANVLGRIDSAAVAAYLTRSGWVREHERRGGAVWSRWIGDHAAKLLVPSDPTFGDYAIRMSEVLAALALTEDRSQLAVLVELIGAVEPVPSGAELIAAERRRQVDEEGWTPEHDDQQGHGELIEAARCYAYAAQMAQGQDVAEWFGLDAEGRIKPPSPINARWPWSSRGWKPSGDSVRNLVQAGALIAAEIDRLTRRRP